ncbi:MAG TPA: transketolase [Gemmatimonadetes bacterium]|nr:transketolase [Gemmatimonadota bacterium]
MHEPPTSLPETADQLCIDAIKVLSMDAVQNANSGHPGTPMALAPVGYLLWTKYLKHNPNNPTWVDRDRFVLSVGHASMLLYSLLYLTGYDLSLEDLKTFRQWESKTPGHPEVHHTPGVETTTGPLGQGISNSVGMALAERWLASRFNRDGYDVIDHYTYALCSDGDLMEGVSHEVAEFAGHQKLGKLVWIFDDNHITIEGNTSLTSSTDQIDRFKSYQWHTTCVEDGSNLDQISEAFSLAKSETERPSLIVLKTRIAEGSPNKVDKSSAHGSPLGLEEIEATKNNIGYPSHEPFYVDSQSLKTWRRTADRGDTLEDDWNELFESYTNMYPELAKEYLEMMRGDLPQDWSIEIPNYSNVQETKATRSWSGEVLQAIAANCPNLIGGSADLGPSNMTDINGASNLDHETPEGRVLRFGIREHGMAGIMNGLALHGGIQPFGGTFLIFSDYMRPSIRLAALMNLPVKYVFTHDSIGLGEDGPTHQPVEQLMTLRAIPNLLDLRPADAAETAMAWRIAMERTNGPTFLSLTRQGVVPLNRTTFPKAEATRFGAYVLAEASTRTPQVVLIASGSEIEIALEAREILEKTGIDTRLVSMPSWYLFSQQTKEYQDSILLPDCPVQVAIEAGSSFGWYRWIGSRGLVIGLDRFGASAPSEDLFDQFGIKVSNIVEKATEALKRYT